MEATNLTAEESVANETYGGYIQNASYASDAETLVLDQVESHTIEYFVVGAGSMTDTYRADSEAELIWMGIEYSAFGHMEASTEALTLSWVNISNITVYAHTLTNPNGYVSSDRGYFSFFPDDLNEPVIILGWMFAITTVIVAAYFFVKDAKVRIREKKNGVSSGKYYLGGPLASMKSKFKTSPKKATPRSWKKDTLATNVNMKRDERIESLLTKMLLPNENTSDSSSKDSLIEYLRARSDPENNDYFSVAGDGNDTEEGPSSPYSASSNIRGVGGGSVRRDSGSVSGGALGGFTSGLGKQSRSRDSRERSPVLNPFIDREGSTARNPLHRHKDASPQNISPKTAPSPARLPTHRKSKTSAW
jgi:hypothetical protein